MGQLCFIKFRILTLYLAHSVTYCMIVSLAARHISFLRINFQSNTDSFSSFSVKTISVTKRSVSQKKSLGKTTNPSFFCKNIGAYNVLILVKATAVFKKAKV